MIVFTRTTDKPLSKSQEKVFYGKDNGIVCHMIDHTSTFDEIVAAVRNYYLQYPEDLIGWDLVSKLFVESGIVKVREVLLESDEYKSLELEAALSLIRLAESGLVKIEFSNENVVIEGIPV